MRKPLVWIGWLLIYLTLTVLSILKGRGPIFEHSDLAFHFFNNVSAVFTLLCADLAVRATRGLLAADAGTARMQEISAAVREGAQIMVCGGLDMASGVRDALFAFANVYYTLPKPESLSQIPGNSKPATERAGLFIVY